jgi:hypothetical protein
MTAVGARFVMELRGVSCLPLEICPRPRKSITVSRSLPQEIESLEEIREAVSTFITRTAEKMRKGTYQPPIKLLCGITLEMTWGETVATQAKMKEEPKQESRCFAPRPLNCYARRGRNPILLRKCFLLPHLRQFSDPVGHDVEVSGNISFQAGQFFVAACFGL